MSNIATTFVGLALFIFQFLIAEYILRTVAVKLHDKPAGQGLAALVF